jgi:cytidylate kinase
MIRVITIEREYGTGGAEIASALAHMLGWKLIDQCLIDEVAQLAKVNPKMAERCDERLDPWYHRLGKAFWHGSVDRITTLRDSDLFDSERMFELASQVIEHAAGQGQCVIVGRGAACLLSKRSDAFHVFLYGSAKYKLRHFKERHPERTDITEEELESHDRRRAAYMRTFFKQDWDARKMYHMMLNACTGEHAIIDSILLATHLQRVPEIA